MRVRALFVPDAACVRALHPHARAGRHLHHIAELKSPLCGLGGTVGTVFNTAPICLSISFAFCARSRACSASSLQKRISDSSRVE